MHKTVLKNNGISGSESNCVVVTVSSLYEWLQRLVTRTVCLRSSQDERSKVTVLSRTIHSCSERVVRCLGSGVSGVFRSSVRIVYWKWDELTTLPRTVYCTIGLADIRLRPFLFPGLPIWPISSQNFRCATVLRSQS